jgi:isocitrate dehydrogenase
LEGETVQVPEGEPVEFTDGRPTTPDKPMIPIIYGDGIGQDIAPATRVVVDAAVSKTYGSQKEVVWLRVYAGEESHRLYGAWLPEETIDAINHYKVALKGPLATPVGEGIRSLNVALRQRLDLYACVRPVRHLRGVPAPIKHPELVDVVIFRENTEDLYAGIEWQEGSQDVKKVIAFLEEEMGKKVRKDSAIGIKPISATATKRVARAAVRYAIEHGRKNITIVHKGNIMKFTEGAFRNWAYEAAREFGDKILTEEDLLKRHNGKVPQGRVLIKDRIADSMFQQILLRPEEYDVIVTPNLNGDYLSDACAAQVGGLGIAPSANINYETGKAIFEATHGTAPKYAGLGKVNPTSLMLSAAMMLDYIGWNEPAERIEKAIEITIAQRKVTYDLARQMEGATELNTRQFTETVAENL